VIARAPRAPDAAPRFAPAAGAFAPAPSAFVPGELLVRFRSPPADAVERFSEVPGLGGHAFRIGAWGSPRIATVRIEDRTTPSRPIGLSETVAVQMRLREHPDVRSVELNHYRWALAEPNDPGYSAQWHYPQLSLPAAWDLTTGSPEVTVAVIDDGVNPHPDLDRVVAGYDFVSDLALAGDGDGRDASPAQVPGSHGTMSVWHGTHVAGTIGAASDDGRGLAGVDWQARLLPVRVLGKMIPGRGQGTSIDIVAGIHWAAGLEVPGVPPNPHPAQVLNLSLGGGPLVQAEQDAVDAAVGRGAVVVVAAGNRGEDATRTSFAGYENVIVAGAVDHDGRRAPYSSFGHVVDLMAPGGDLGADANADGQPDGVLSTYLDNAGQRAGVEYLEGTSMAAAHVAGVAALVKAARPGLPPAQLETLLTRTALASSRCPEGCGAGLVNAARAVLAARGGPAPDRAPELELGSARLNLGTRDRGFIQVVNAGGGELAWRARLEGPHAARLDLAGERSGQLGPGAAAQIELTIDRGALPDGNYQSALVVTDGERAARAPVLFRVGPPELADVGRVLVGAVGFDDRGEVVVGGSAVTDRARGYRFRIDAEPGAWLIIALADRNDSGDLDAGDLWGLHARLDAPAPVEVVGGGELRLAPFDLVPFQGRADVAPPCRAYRACFEACGGDADCRATCPVSQACGACLHREVESCARRAECAMGDLACLCDACAARLEPCMGPLLCSGS
jgi:serine protease